MFCFFFWTPFTTHSFCSIMPQKPSVVLFESNIVVKIEAAAVEHRNFEDKMKRLLIFPYMAPADGHEHELHNETIETADVK